jgi:hypothetical protein
MGEDVTDGLGLQLVQTFAFRPVDHHEFDQNLGLTAATNTWSR